MGEIYFNKLLYPGRARIYSPYDQSGFLAEVSGLYPQLGVEWGGAGRTKAFVTQVEQRFQAILRATPQRRLFPEEYNADPTFAFICTAVAQTIAPTVILEVGVGYGVITSLLLQALAQGGPDGRLASIDLPPLADPYGTSVGMLVPTELATERWQLFVGSSRQTLGRALQGCNKLDMFVSDGANVGTLQRWELRTVWPKLRPGGVAVFNNIGAHFQSFAAAVPQSSFGMVPQERKKGCVTGILLKRFDPATSTPAR